MAVIWVLEELQISELGGSTHVVSTFSVCDVKTSSLELGCKLVFLPTGSVRGGRMADRALKSSRNSFLLDKSNGNLQLSFWKKILWSVVSMMAPRLRQTLLEIKNGVLVSTTAILIQN